MNVHIVCPLSRELIPAVWGCHFFQVLKSFHYYDAMEISLYLCRKHCHVCIPGFLFINTKGHFFCLQFSMQRVFLLRYEYFLWHNINISTNLFGFVNIPFSTVLSRAIWIMIWIMLLTVHHCVVLLWVYVKVCHYLLWALQKVVSLNVICISFIIYCGMS